MARITLGLMLCGAYASAAPPRSNLSQSAGFNRCIFCGETLFESDTKFDARCGWPSFSKPAAEGKIAEEV
jgi:peptide methionine sulfoxide reductase MsrB